MAEENKGIKKKEVPKKKVRKARKNPRRVFIDLSTISSWTIVRVVLLAFVIWSLGGFVTKILYSLTFLFFLIVLAIFLAYLLDPFVKIIRRPFKDRNLEYWMPRSLAIGITYILVFTIFGTAIANLAPVLTTQATEFATNLPNYAGFVQEQITALNNRFDQLMISQQMQLQLNEQIELLIGNLGRLITSFAGIFVLNLAIYLPWMIVVPILAFFFLKDVNLYTQLFLRFFPSGRWRARADSFIKDVNKTLAAYARAQIISCFLIGTICTIIFYSLGLDYALLLGILAGVFEFVPLLGPLTLGILAILVGAFSENPWQALYVAVLLGTLRIIHDYFTYPRIVREGIHLHPLAVILSVLAGEQVAGIPGVFLSIPIVALLTVLYKHFRAHTGGSGMFSKWFESEKRSAEAE